MEMFRRRSAQGSDSPPDVYDGLRTAALEVTEAMVGTTPPGHPDVVLGVVVDIPSEGGVASVVAMADGTTSMYTSTGGGTIGAGSHQSVAAATHALLTTLQRLLEMFPPDDRVDLPPADLVHITRSRPPVAGERASRRPPSGATSRAR